MNANLERLLHKLHVKLVAPSCRVLAGFWSWWSGELLAAAPESFRNFIAEHNQRIVVTVEETDFVLTKCGPSTQQDIGRIPVTTSGNEDLQFPDRIREIILCLPPDKVLTSSMTFPLATEENMYAVLGFEMDRQTPFSVDQVYYDYRVTERSSANRTITLDLVVTPRKLLQQLLDALSRVGIHPDVVTTQGQESTTLLPVNLLPKPGRPTRRVIVHRLNTTLAAICALLLLTALALPLIKKQQQIRQIEPQLTAALAAAGDGIELRQQVEKLTTGSEFLVQKKRSTVSVLQIIAEISRILPDSTWLSKLDIHATEIQIQGQSSAAATLIQLLESSSLLRNARFRSPVVQVPRTSMERFHISVELETEDAS